METIKEWDLKISVDQVLRGQGADPEAMRRRRPEIVQAAEWALQEGLPLLQPSVLQRDLEVDEMRHERLKLKGAGSLSGRLISQHLAGAERVTVFLCTVGPQLEAVASEVLRSEPLLGLALDGVGTAAIEALASSAAARLEQQAHARGWQASIPLSPGMVGWPVDPGQMEVFNLIDASSIGVHLTSSLMMVPTKSLTQVLGFGKEMSFQGRTCDFCSLKETCRYQEHYLDSRREA